MSQFISHIQKEYHTFCDQFNQLPSSLKTSVVAKTILIATVVGLATACLLGSTYAPLTFLATLICVSKFSPSFLNLNRLLKKAVEGNATATEFVSCVNSNISALKITALRQEEAEEFLNRGGSLNVITEEKMKRAQVTISKNEQIITGCTSGINRSQVAAAIVKQMGITLKGVLAGGESAMNQEAFAPFCVSPLGGESATNFQAAFGYSKLDQIGGEADCEDQEEADSKYYQQYIDDLSHTFYHILIKWTFSP